MIGERAPGDDRAPFAPALLRLRFPAMERRPEAAFGIVDRCHGARRDADPEHAPRAIPRGAAIYVAGWIWSPLAANEAEVVVTVDGANAALASAALARPDVAQTYGPSAARSGFEALLPSHGLEPGEHTLEVVLLHDAMSYLAGPRRQIRVVNTALPAHLDLPVVPRMRVSIDALADADGGGEEYARAPSVRNGATLSVTGWAADLGAAQPCAGVYALVDDAHLVRGRYGAPRPDVTESLAIARVLYCGFDVRIDTAAFGIGDHDVRIVALNASGDGRSGTTPPHPFTIRPD